jgi:hypothetical protein
MTQKMKSFIPFGAKFHATQTGWGGGMQVEKLFLKSVYHSSQKSVAKVTFQN